MHIRKPSSSDSVSSLSSTSTTTTPASSPTRSVHRCHSRAIEFDPLCLNPTFQAPPRLAERPFKHMDAYHEHLDAQPRQPTGPELELPPVNTPTTSSHDRRAAPGYFHLDLDLIRRPTLQRSHWSESTIQTIDVEEHEKEQHDADDDDEASMAGAATPVVAAPTIMPTPPLPSRSTYQERLVRPPERWQNFSYKRNTVPRRPPMVTGDSIENYIKRGGWKRRGIVFQQSESGLDNSDNTDRYSAHTVI